MKPTHFDQDPNRYARLCGLLYLFVILFGMFSEGFVLNRLVTPGDPTHTARNIAGAAQVWNVSAAGNLLVVLLAVPQMWIEYLLLKPVGKNLALLFLLLNVVSLSVEAVSKVFLLLVLPLVTKPQFAAAFSEAQVAATVNLSLMAHNLSFNVALIFFGLACLVLGHLIRKSEYLPAVFGGLMQLAGLSYLIACFAQLFAPKIANSISPAILLPVLVGEASLCLRLLIKGVNVAKWRETSAG